MSAYAISKPIYEIKSTEDKTNIYTPMLYGSGKTVLSFGFMDSSASPKIRGGGFGKLLVILYHHIRSIQAKVL